MKIKIQESVPYKDSLKWQIHNNYFQKKGIDAWKLADIPFHITSNYQAAYQNAKVIFEVINNISKASKLKETFYILEVASGLGLFAINFFEAFSKICKQQKKDYHKNIHYMVTDYSEKNLRELSSNVYLSELLKDGLLDFYILDAMNLEGIKQLNNKEFTLKKEMIDVVIANYIHC